MKKSILFLLMMVFLSTNLYAEELHYHKEMWCLKPDGTPNGITEVKDGVTYIYIPDAGTDSIDELKKQSLQEVYAFLAKVNGFPKIIPSKKTTYTLRNGTFLIEVEPISKNQVLLIFIEREAPTREPALLTYYPDKHLTRQTFCYEMP